MHGGRPPSLRGRAPCVIVFVAAVLSPEFWVVEGETSPPLPTPSYACGTAAVGVGVECVSPTGIDVSTLVGLKPNMVVRTASNCYRGQYAWNGFCIACPMGKIRYHQVPMNDNYANPCEDCPTGKYSAPLPRTLALSRQIGYSPTGGRACLSCNSGGCSGRVYDPVAKTCKCIPHATNDGGCVCRCSRGYTTTTPGVCEPCASGKFKDTISDEECLSCPPNTYTDATGTQCNPVPLTAAAFVVANPSQVFANNYGKGSSMIAGGAVMAMPFTSAEMASGSVDALCSPFRVQPGVHKESSFYEYAMTHLKSCPEQPCTKANAFALTERHYVYCTPKCCEGTGRARYCTSGGFDGSGANRGYGEQTPELIIPTGVYPPFTTKRECFTLVTGQPQVCYDVPVNKDTQVQEEPGYVLPVWDDTTPSWEMVRRGKVTEISMSVYQGKTTGYGLSHNLDSFYTKFTDLVSPGHAAMSISFGPSVATLEVRVMLADGVNAAYRLPDGTNGLASMTRVFLGRTEVAQWPYAEQDTVTLRIESGTSIGKYDAVVYSNCRLMYKMAINPALALAFTPVHFDEIYNVENAANKIKYPRYTGTAATEPPSPPAPSPVPVPFMRSRFVDQAVRKTANGNTDAVVIYATTTNSPGKRWGCKIDVLYEKMQHVCTAPIKIEVNAASDLRKCMRACAASTGCDVIQWKDAAWAYSPGSTDGIGTTRCELVYACHVTSTAHGVRVQHSREAPPHVRYALRMDLHHMGDAWTNWQAACTSEDAPAQPSVNGFTSTPLSKAMYGTATSASSSVYAAVEDLGVIHVAAGHTVDVVYGCKSQKACAENHVVVVRVDHHHHHDAGVDQSFRDDGAGYPNAWSPTPQSRPDARLYGRDFLSARLPAASDAASRPKYGKPPLALGGDPPTGTAYVVGTMANYEGGSYKGPMHSHRGTNWWGLVENEPRWNERLIPPRMQSYSGPYYDLEYFLLNKATCNPSGTPINQGHKGSSADPTGNSPHYAGHSNKRSPVPYLSCDAVLRACTTKSIVQADWEASDCHTIYGPFHSPKRASMASLRTNQLKRHCFAHYCVARVPMPGSSNPPVELDPLWPDECDAVMQGVTYEQCSQAFTTGSVDLPFSQEVMDDLCFSTPALDPASIPKEIHPRWKKSARLCDGTDVSKLYWDCGSPAGITTVVIADEPSTGCLANAYLKCRAQLACDKGKQGVATTYPNMECSFQGHNHANARILNHMNREECAFMPKPCGGDDADRSSEGYDLDGYLRTHQYSHPVESCGAPGRNIKDCSLQWKQGDYTRTGVKPTSLQKCPGRTAKYMETYKFVNEGCRRRANYPCAFSKPPDSLAHFVTNGHVPPEHDESTSHLACYHECSNAGHVGVAWTGCYNNCRNRRQTEGRTRIRRLSTQRARDGRTISPDSCFVPPRDVFATGKYSAVEDKPYVPKPTAGRRSETPVRETGLVQNSRRVGDIDYVLCNAARNCKPTCRNNNGRILLVTGEDKHVPASTSWDIAKGTMQGLQGTGGSPFTLNKGAVTNATSYDDFVKGFTNAQLKSVIGKMGDSTMTCLPFHVLVASQKSDSTIPTWCSNDPYCLHGWPYKSQYDAACIEPTTGRPWTELCAGMELYGDITRWKTFYPNADYCGPETQLDARCAPTEALLTMRRMASESDGNKHAGRGCATLLQNKHTLQYYGLYDTTRTYQAETFVIATKRPDPPSTVQAHTFVAVPVATLSEMAALSVFVGAYVAFSRPSSASRWFTYSHPLSGAMSLKTWSGKAHVQTYGYPACSAQVDTLWREPKRTQTYFSGSPGRPRCQKKGSPTCYEQVQAAVASAQGLLDPILAQNALSDDTGCLKPSTTEVTRRVQDAQSYGVFVACAPGQYFTGAQCAACPTGRYSDATGATTCASQPSCEPGEVISRNATLSVSKQCAACPGTSYTEVQDATVCLQAAPCAPGYRYVAPTVLHVKPPTCTICPNGTFSSTTNAGACTPCDGTNTYSSSEGASQCTPQPDCLPGTYVATQGSPSTKRVCPGCPYGKYSDAKNQAHCSEWTSPCPAGQRRSEASNSTLAGRCAACDGSNEYSSTVGTNASRAVIGSCTPFAACDFATQYLQVRGDSKTKRICAAKRACNATTHYYVPSSAESTHDRNCIEQPLCDTQTHYVAVEGSATSRRVCMSNCIGGRYIKDGVCTECPHGRYSGALNSRSVDDCKPQDYCPPGTHVLNPYGGTDTAGLNDVLKYVPYSSLCDGCTGGTYTDAPNRNTSCTPFAPCDFATQYVQVRGGSKTKRMCVAKQACNATTHYYVPSSAESTHDRNCIEQPRCDPRTHYVAVEGSATSRRVCMSTEADCDAVKRGFKDTRCCELGDAGANQTLAKVYTLRNATVRTCAEARAEWDRACVTECNVN